jgi:hypothetical protein
MQVSLLEQHVAAGCRLLLAPRPPDPRQDALQVRVLTLACNRMFMLVRGVWLLLLAPRPPDLRREALPCR